MSRIKIIIFLFLTLFAFPSKAATNGKSFVVVIDPGHGGKDAGAVGKKGKEKNINLAVGLLLGEYITEKHPDVKIIYTRKRDIFIGLNERAEIANKANADLFISIHTNAVQSSRPRGAEVYTFGLSRTKENLEVAKRENSVILLEDNYEQKYEGFDPNSSESYIIFEFIQNKFVEQSVDFASIVQKELVKTANRENRGVKQAEYLVLRKSSMPRVLVELDFISNANAESYLLSASGQRNLARAICNAFSEYKRDYDRKSGAITSEKPSSKTTIDYTTTKEEEIETALPVASKEKIEKQIKSTTGKVYKVQILVSPKKLPKKSRELKGYKADYYVEKKLYKYTYGESTDWNEINKIRKSLLKDFKDAFIVAFENGKKVPNK